LLADSSAGDLGWSRVPLGRLHSEATVTALSSAGVMVRCSARVRSLDRIGEEFRLVLDTDSVPVDQVVLAVPPPAAEALLPGGGSHAPAGWSERLGASPIVNVHVRYDRRVTGHEFFATVGSPVQWAFDRTEGSGAGEGQYLAVSLSAAGRQIEAKAADLVGEVVPALAAVLPAARDARILDSWVTRERTATFRAVPGSAALRPPARTDVPGIALAGAWTATGWPATMEGAVRSGHAAAEVLLSTATPPAVGAGSFERGTM
jgi:predicted NAD/FAD-dependent oxidoreductase